MTEIRIADVSANQTDSPHKTKPLGVGYVLTTGLMATITMDLVALLAVSTGLVQLGSYRIVPQLLGRWVGCFVRRRPLHSTILDTSPIPHEALLGLLSHYLIGVTLTSVFLYFNLRLWRRTPSLWAALFFGLATCIFPYLLMF